MSLMATSVDEYTDEEKHHTEGEKDDDEVVTTYKIMRVANALEQKKSQS